MADAITNITIFHAKGIPPATPADEYILDTSARTAAVTAAANKLLAIAGGVEGGQVAIRVDSATGAAASGAVVVEADDTVAGDLFLVTIPGYTTVSFAAVATDAEVTAAPYTGLWSLETVTDTAQAASLTSAINDHPATRDFLLAEESSGTITLTAKRTGTSGNGIVLAKEVTTSTALAITAMASGLDITAKPTIVLTFGSANITAGDTISIGAREYTWAASASADGEITLSTTEATAATNFKTAIDADATWTGLMTCERSTAVITLTWEGDPRCGKHMVVVLTETNAGSIVVAGTALTTAAESFPLTTTVTGSSVTKRYAFGAV